MGPTKLLLHLLDFPNQSFSFLKMLTVGFFIYSKRTDVFFFLKKKSTHTIFSGVILSMRCGFRIFA
jgi:hypothetical protein